MRVVILGGAGEMGSLVARLLSGRGHDVVPASRASGVDATTGDGLDAALTGADVVVDCLNITTASKGRATAFFTTTAQHVIGAARRTGVPHLVLTSIVNVTDAGVRRALGYYAAKAAQEEAYVKSGLPVTVVASTAWFSLAEQFLTQAHVGPVAVVPAMTLQPVDPAAVAAALAEAVEAGAPPARVRRIQLAGPERLRADAMARDLAAATGRRVRVIGAPFPSRTFRASGLVPRGDVITDSRRYAEWLADVTSAAEE